MKKKFIIFSMFTVFAFLFVSCADGIKGSLNDGTAAISGTGTSTGSGDSSTDSGTGGGNSNSSTYTTVAGGTYINSLSNTGFAFNDDYSVNMIIASTNIKINGSKWRIVNGNTVEIYVEGMDIISNTFTANSTFTELTYTSYGTSVVYTRQ